MLFNRHRACLAALSYAVKSSHAVHQSMHANNTNCFSMVYTRHDPTTFSNFPNITIATFTVANATIRFLKEWGIDSTNTTRGGLTEPAHDDGKHREIWLCQRKKGTLGKGLGKTTGWIHRTK
jgi:hypothetical protein